jgi:ABC-2 type transport system permease protein
MNYAMIQLLILKDWYLHRWEILGSLAGAAAAMAFVVFCGTAGFYIGITLLITVLVVVGAQLAFSSSVTERKEQTLAFIMSLPISYRDYTTAKILSNLLIFLIPWTVVSLASAAILLLAPGATQGLFPFTAIMCVEILLNTCLISSVAIMTESQVWTTTALIIGNVAVNILGYLVAHIRPIAAGMTGHNIAWTTAATMCLLGELALIALLFTLTYFVQSRKPDYL